MNPCRSVIEAIRADRSDKLSCAALADLLEERGKGELAAWVREYLPSRRPAGVGEFSWWNSDAYSMPEDKGVCSENDDLPLLLWGLLRVPTYRSNSGFKSFPSVAEAYAALYYAIEEVANS